MAKDVFTEMFSQGRDPSAIVEERGLTQMNDSSRLLLIIEEVVDSNPQPVQDYLSGKESASKFLLGQVMKLTQGSANPELTHKLLVDCLKSLTNSNQ